MVCGIQIGLFGCILIHTPEVPQAARIDWAAIALTHQTCKTMSNILAKYALTGKHSHVAHNCMTDVYSDIVS